MWLFKAVLFVILSSEEKKLSLAKTMSDSFVDSTRRLELGHDTAARVDTLGRSRNTRMHSVVGRIAGIAWLGWVLPVNAEPAVGVDGFQWTAPEPCPKQGAMRERLRESLGGQLDPIAALPTVRGTIIRGEAEYRLTLKLRDASTRQLQAASCDDLSEAALLAIVLSLRQFQDSLLVPEAAEPVTSLGDDGANPEAGPESKTWFLAGRGSGFIDSGTLPTVSLGVTVGLFATWDSWELGVSALGLPEQSLPITTAEAVHFGFWAAGLNACQRRELGFLFWTGCLHIEAGQVTATGLSQVGEDAVSKEDQWWAPGASVGFETAISRVFRFELRGQVATPINRQRYVIDGEQPVHTVPRWVARLSLGVSATIP